MSSVTWIMPCPEFSTGTTPKSAWPAATSWNTSSMLPSGKPVGGMTEMLAHGLLAEGALGAEKADLQRILLRQAGRHDLAEQPHHLGIRQRPVVAIDHHAQHVRLALGPVIVDGRKALNPSPWPPSARASARSEISCWICRSMLSMRSRISLSGVFCRSCY